MTVYPRVSNGVSKLGIAIGTLNFPAGITCRKNAPCAKGCYAMKGNFIYSTVKNGLMNNYEAYKEDPKRFFNVIHNQLEMIPYKFFRWFSSGDIVDEQFLDGMCKLARQHKGTNFLCFTKQYEIVNGYLSNHRKPKNLTLVLSSWGEWIPDNPHKLPMSYVEFGKESDELIPEDAIKCSGNCGECVKIEGSNCWQLQKGESVYFHKH